MINSYPFVNSLTQKTKRLQQKGSHAGQPGTLYSALPKFGSFWVSGIFYWILGITNSVQPVGNQWLSFNRQLTAICLIICFCKDIIARTANAPRAAWLRVSSVGRSCSWRPARYPRFFCTMGALWRIFSRQLCVPWKMRSASDLIFWEAQLDVIICHLVPNS